MECIFCEGKLKDFFLRKSEYWSVYLNENQCYLGRVYIVLNRHGPEDTISLTKKEWNDLKGILDEITEVIKYLFKPDLFNYLTLQNKDRNHFHMHLIPRYGSSRFVYEKEFKDELWGKPPVPIPKVEFSKGLLIQIRDSIIQEL